MLRTLVTRSSKRVFSSSTSSVPAGCYLPREQVTARVTEVVKATRKYDSIKPNAHFVADLKLDSLLRKALIADLGKEFCVSIPADSSEKILSVDAAVNYFATHPKAR
jgi:acyl carrier protein